MAFPSAGTPVSTTFATSATSMPVNMPATVNSGDLLISLVEVRNAGTWTKPTGWSDISTLSQTGGGSVGKLNGFYKIADGTEAGTTPTWTASTGTTAVWQTIRVTSWHGTTPPESTSASGDATNANPPSLTPSWGAADTLWIAVAANAATGETTGFTAAPTNYTGLQSNGASTGGSTTNIASATRQLNASSEDPGTFTPNNNRFWAAGTIGVAPASGAVNASVAQVAATVTATGGTQSISTVNIVSIAQVAAAVTASGGAQLVATPQSTSISQLAATITSTGGTQSIITINNVVITQSSGNTTATGGTQSVATINNSALAQVAANIIATGGTQGIAPIRMVGISQNAANLTATGSAQEITTVRIGSVSQTAATLTATGGTQSIAAIGIVAISQIVAAVTATGGTQDVAAAAIISTSVTQLAATITATGGTQTIVAERQVFIIQEDATITATGGIQAIATISYANIYQVGGMVNAIGGIQGATGAEPIYNIDNPNYMRIEPGISLSSLSGIDSTSFLRDANIPGSSQQFANSDSSTIMRGSIDDSNAGASLNDQVLAIRNTGELVIGQFTGYDGSTLLHGSTDDSGAQSVSSDSRGGM